MWNVQDAVNWEDNNEPEAEHDEGGKDIDVMGKKMLSDTFQESFSEQSFWTINNILSLGNESIKLSL